MSSPAKRLRPIGIDLFSGVGGLSLGFEQAGFDVAAAVEIDPIHCAAHEFNFPECKVISRSISDLSGAEIRRLAGLDKKPVDVVFGGAPCQGFSLIGHRAMDDPRNNLVRDFVRIVAELEAAYFVFENVRGLTIGKHKSFLNELIEEFHTCGYSVQLPWKVLNASAYGVPQDRRRLILMGARDGLPPLTYPSPTTQPVDDRLQLALLPRGPSVRDALGDLPDADQFEALKESDEAHVVRWERPSVVSMRKRCDVLTTAHGRMATVERGLKMCSRRARVLNIRESQ